MKPANEDVLVERLMRRILVAVLVFAATACASSQPHSVSEAAETWIGDPIDKLRAKWGEPQQVIPQDDAAIYRYELHWRGTNAPTIVPQSSVGSGAGTVGGVGMTGSSTSVGNTYVPGQPIQKTCAVNFRVQQGVIRDFTTVGQDCHG